MSIGSLAVTLISLVKPPIVQPIGSKSSRFSHNESRPWFLDFIGVTVVASMVSACSGAPTVPLSVQRIINSPLPSDGKLYVQKAGNFIIDDRTRFCTFRPGFGIEGLGSAILRSDKSKNLSVTERANGTWGRKTTHGCTQADSPRNRSVFIYGVAGNNRSGGPYRIDFAIWQGTSFWIARIERPDGKRQDATADTLPIGDDISVTMPSREVQRRAAYAESSRQLDLRDISNQFLDFAIGDAL